MKRHVANASLKANHDNCILKPKQLYEWGGKNIKGIFFFYVPSETVHEYSLKYDLAVDTVDGTTLFLLPLLALK